MQYSKNKTLEKKMMGLFEMIFENSFIVFMFSGNNKSCLAAVLANVFK